jgi:hypothetical protein
MQSIDGRLLLKVAAQLENLRDRVTELENRERVAAQAIARHAEALEAIRIALSEDGEEIDERTMIQ